MQRFSALVKLSLDEYNSQMDFHHASIQELRDRIQGGDLDLMSTVDNALARANSNAGRNVYVSLNGSWTLSEAEGLPRRFADATTRPALYGLPVSLKDCFDLEGFSTSCGSRFYAEYNGRATANSWVTERLRREGAVLIGKTHLHQLAYGITGENSDYGDCVQPANRQRLTGGSSSGAAASIQEGSAIAAIGTDTGGSIRVPAALCGLSGYRSSLGFGYWRGAAHLAPSFDTLGWLFRDLRDAPMLANALFAVPAVTHLPEKPLRIGSIDQAFLHDCDLPVLRQFEAFQQELVGLGATVFDFDTSQWSDSFEIFSAIQATEAATIHTGFFEYFEPAIAERLAWGASIPEETVARLRLRHGEFRSRFDHLFQSYDFLILPCAPVNSLIAGADHSATRQRVLRYTTPASLAGTPVVVVPLEDGAGIQLIGRHGSDAALVAFAAFLGERRRGQI